MKLTVSEAFAAVLLLQALPEGRESIAEIEAMGRLSESFANDCNSLYADVSEVLYAADKGRTIRDFLPPMRVRHR